MRFFLALLLFTVFSATAVFAAPQVHVEQLNHDFGDVIQGDKVDYTYRFRNDGDQILQIGNVRTSCGCTAALLSARRIAPGDMGELRVTFDSTRFRGAVTKTITMDTNDPQKSQVSFSLYGNVKAELLMTPERISWGSVATEGPLEEVVEIANKGEHTIILADPRSTSPEVRAELDGHELPPGGKVTLRITAKFAEQDQRIGGYVIIPTNYENVPQLRLPVSARLKR